MINGQHIDENPLETDVVFLIEATSMNGTYINELKTNYIQPILEHFNQGPFEKNENSCDNRNCLYTIILYHAADVRPKPCCRTYAQEKDPQFVLNVIEKVRLAGGKAQSNANVAEGLATCLQFFDDIKKSRDGCQKCCVLICTSPPSAIPVMENEQYSGSNLEQLASLFAERKIFLSVLSPRKIPALFKLFEKTGGDLTHASSKNYSKNGRHLVLLNGLCLKEIDINPSNITPTHSTLPVSSPKNPGNVGSPTPVVPYRQATPQSTSGQVQHPVPTVDINTQQHMQPLQQAQPQQSSQVQQAQQQLLQQQQHQQQVQQQQQQSNQPHQMIQQSLQHNSQPPQMMPQQQTPQMNPAVRPVAFVSPSLSQSQLNFPRGPGQQAGKWASIPGPQQRPYSPATQSALIAQLQQPPSSIPSQLTQRYDGPVLNQPQNQQQMQFQHQLQHQQQQQQQQPQIRMVSANPVLSAPGNSLPPQQISYERNPIWQGILEWTEKSKAPNTLTRQIACCVTLASKDKDIDLKTETWPPKLTMQLLPKQLIIGAGQNLRKAISVCFHPSPSASLDALRQIMGAAGGFAGCVQFNHLPTSSPTDIKMLLLLYTPEKEMFVGLVPNDQGAFFAHLRQQIQMRRNQTIAQNSVESGQTQNSTGSQTPGPTGDMQGHIPSGMMQTSNMNNPLVNQPSRIGGLMAGDMSHGGVGPGGGMMQGGPSSQGSMMHGGPPNQGSIMQGGPTNQASMMQGGPANQASILHQNPNTVNVQQGINIRGNPMLAPRIPIQADAEFSRQQNLANIQRLQQQLNAAKQQEQLYQTIELQPQYTRHQLVNIQVQQQQPPQGRNHPNAVQTPQSNEQFDDQSFFIN